MSKGVQLHDNTGDKVFPCSYFPIGSIYMSLSSINPSTYFGGTWERIANGRVLAGINENDTDKNAKTSFNQEAGSALGSKYLHSHEHLTHNWANTTAGGGINAGKTYYGQAGSANMATNATTKTGSGDSQNIQPTLLCYIWTRTK